MFVFFFNDPATTDIYTYGHTLSLHDALPIFCFVDRPHELDDACLHLADTMLWCAAWNVSLRDGTGVKSAIVPVPELDDWIAVLPDRLAEAATMQRAAIRRSRGALHLGERTEIGRAHV